MWITHFIRERRWFFSSLGAAILIPAVTILALGQFAEDVSEDEALEVAAVAVKNYVDQNPPRQGWRATDIYIGASRNVVVDVHVPNFDHAAVIQSRNERVRFSYLKLACPPANAWVYDWLEGRDRIWINLHHHGETLLKAPCPNGAGKGFFSVG